MDSQASFFVRFTNFLIMHSHANSQPKIVIAGGNGFLGQHLRDYFQALNYRVLILSRSRKFEPNQVYWDARTLGPGRRSWKARPCSSTWRAGQWTAATPKPTSVKF